MRLTRGILRARGTVDASCLAVPLAVTADLATLVRPALPRERSAREPISARIVVSSILLSLLRSGFSEREREGEKQRRETHLSTQ